jgi:hypothetical protein
MLVIGLDSKFRGLLGALSDTKFGALGYGAVIEDELGVASRTLRYYGRRYGKYPIQGAFKFLGRQTREVDWRLTTYGNIAWMKGQDCVTGCAAGLRADATTGLSELRTRIRRRIFELERQTRMVKKAT